MNIETFKNAQELLAAISHAKLKIVPYKEALSLLGKCEKEVINVSFSVADKDTGIHEHSHQDFRLPRLMCALETEMDHEISLLSELQKRFSEL